MVIGLHGDSTADVPRPVVEVHSIEQELAITQHPPVVANIVLDHLSKQTRAIPKGVLVIKLYLTLFVFIVRLFLCFAPAVDSARAPCRKKKYNVKSVL